MFIETVIFSVAVGYMLGGSVGKLKDADIAHIELIFIAFIYESVLVLAVRRGLRIGEEASYWAYALMYVILFVFVWLNRRKYQVDIMGIGFLMNAVAIFANGGRMPVSKAAIDRAGIGYMLENGSLFSRGYYRLLDGSTLFPYLGDTIPKRFVPPAVVSPGDIVIGISLFLLITGMMGCGRVLKGGRR